MADRVLLVTGGYVSVRDTSLWTVLKKQLASYRSSSGAWYDLHLKALNAELMMAVRGYQRTAAFAGAPYAARVRDYFTDERLFEAPELADVILGTLLEREGITFSSATYAELFADAALRERLLDDCRCVFASTTLLRDLSELAPMVAMLSRPDNHVVAGGALASALADDWEGCPGLDVLAVGYGELLVPILVEWLRSGYSRLEPPEGGRCERRARTLVVRAPPPASKSPDNLPTPDWQLAERAHDSCFRMIHYESVRGCPYRCAFCGYPFLFADRTYRSKSPARVVEEWVGYAAAGVELVSCLDSVMTTPRSRLVELCERLIDAGAPVRWIGYARGDDLTDPELCRLLARAGCHHLQIGAESGSQLVLDNMNKRLSVSDNLAGIANCHAVGIGTLVTVILGYPGETVETVRETWEFLRAAEPDFCYATPFTVRGHFLPVLDPAARERFGLRTWGGARSSSPYWAHDTMDASEVGTLWRDLHRRMMRERVALDGALFYKGMLGYRRDRDRASLLDFQRDALCRWSPTAALARRLGAMAGRRLRNEVRRYL
jgi:radical SAM superfamily enzyme YgiQ (UPF0313 family)